MLLLNGKADFEVDDLRKNVSYEGGLKEEEILIMWLWEIVEEWKPQKRAGFLRFVTGTDRMPLDGLQPPMRVTKVRWLKHNH